MTCYEYVIIAKARIGKPGRRTDVGSMTPTSPIIDLEARELKAGGWEVRALYREATIGDEAFKPSLSWNTETVASTRGRAAGLLGALLLVEGWIIERVEREFLREAVTVEDVHSALRELRYLVNDREGDPTENRLHLAGDGTPRLGPESATVEAGIKAGVESVRASGRGGIWGDFIGNDPALARAEEKAKERLAKADLIRQLAVQMEARDKWAAAADRHEARANKAEHKLQETEALLEAAEIVREQQAARLDRCKDQISVLTASREEFKRRAEELARGGS